MAQQKLEATISQALRAFDQRVKLNAFEIADQVAHEVVKELKSEDKALIAREDEVPLDQVDTYAYARVREVLIQSWKCL